MTGLLHPRSDPAHSGYISNTEKVRIQLKVLFAQTALLTVGLDAKWPLGPDFPNAQKLQLLYEVTATQKCGSPLKWCLKFSRLSNGCNASQRMTRDNLRSWDFILTVLLYVPRPQYLLIAGMLQRALLAADYTQHPSSGTHSDSWSIAI